MQRIWKRNEGRRGRGPPTDSQEQWFNPSSPARSDSAAYTSPWHERSAFPNDAPMSAERYRPPDVFLRQTRRAREAETTEDFFRLANITAQLAKNRLDESSRRNRELDAVRERAERLEQELSRVRDKEEQAEAGARAASRAEALESQISRMQRHWHEEVRELKALREANTAMQQQKERVEAELAAERRRVEELRNNLQAARQLLQQSQGSADSELHALCSRMEQEIQRLRAEQEELSLFAGQGTADDDLAILKAENEELQTQKTGLVSALDEELKAKETRGKAKPPARSRPRVALDEHAACTARVQEARHLLFLCIRDNEHAGANFDALVECLEHPCANRHAELSPCENALQGPVLKALWPGSLLHMACEAVRVDMVQRLLRAGCDTSKRDGWGRSCSLAVAERLLGHVRRTPARSGGTAAQIDVSLVSDLEHILRDLHKASVANFRLRKLLPSYALQNNLRVRVWREESGAQSGMKCVVIRRPSAQNVVSTRHALISSDSKFQSKVMRHVRRCDDSNEEYRDWEYDSTFLRGKRHVRKESITHIRLKDGFLGLVCFLRRLRTDLSLQHELRGSDARASCPMLTEEEMLRSKLAFLKLPSFQRDFHPGDAFALTPAKVSSTGRFAKALEAIAAKHELGVREDSLVFQGTKKLSRFVEEMKTDCSLLDDLIAAGSADEAATATPFAFGPLGVCPLTNRMPDDCCALDVLHVAFSEALQLCVTSSAAWSLKHVMQLYRFFLRREMAVDVADELGRTPLHWSAARGDAEQCALLLARKADPTQTDFEGQTPLHVACQSGCAGTISLLLDQGDGSVRLLDRRLRSPLHCIPFSRSGDEFIAALQRLVAKSELSFDVFGQTALHLCAAYGSMEAFRCLQSHFNEFDLFEKKAVKVAVESKNQAVLSVISGRLQAMRLSVDLDLGTLQAILRCDTAGMEPLVALAWKQWKRQALPWFPFSAALVPVLQKLQDLNYAHRHWPPICVAVCSGSSDVVEALLAAGASTQPPDAFLSPMTLAVLTGQELIIDVLLRHGAALSEMVPVHSLLSLVEGRALSGNDVMCHDISHLVENCCSRNGPVPSPGGEIGVRNWMTIDRVPVYGVGLLTSNATLVAKLWQSVEAQGLHAITRSGGRMPALHLLLRSLPACYGAGSKFGAWNSIATDMAKMCSEVYIERVAFADGFKMLGFMSIQYGRNKKDGESGGEEDGEIQIPDLQDVFEEPESRHRDMFMPQPLQDAEKTSKPKAAVPLLSTCADTLSLALRQGFVDAAQHLITSTSLLNGAPSSPWIALAGYQYRTIPLLEAVIAGDTANVLNLLQRGTQANLVVTITKKMYRTKSVWSSSPYSLLQVALLKERVGTAGALLGSVFRTATTNQHASSLARLLLRTASSCIAWPDSKSSSWSESYRSPTSSESRSTVAVDGVALVYEARQRYLGDLPGAVRWSEERESHHCVWGRVAVHVTIADNIEGANHVADGNAEREAQRIRRSVEKEEGTEPDITAVFPNQQTGWGVRVRHNKYRTWTSLLNNRSAKELVSELRPAMDRVIEPEAWSTASFREIASSLCVCWDLLHLYPPSGFQALLHSLQRGVLLRACRVGDAKLARYVLDEGAAMDEMVACTMILPACERRIFDFYSRSDDARSLVEHLSPLGAAALGGHVETVELLLGRGARVALGGAHSNGVRYSALHLLLHTAPSKRVAIGRDLSARDDLGQGAQDPQAGDVWSQLALKMLPVEERQQTHKREETPGESLVVPFLTGRYWDDTISMAIRKGYGALAAKLIRDCPAWVDGTPQVVMDGSESEVKCLPLIEAVRQCDARLVELLLEQKASPLLRDHRGSCLFTASMSLVALSPAHHSRGRAVLGSEAAGAINDLFQVCWKKLPPLEAMFLAARSGNAETFRNLWNTLSEDPQVTESTCPRGRSLLENAIRGGNADILKLLLDKEWNVKREVLDPLVKLAVEAGSDKAALMLMTARGQQPCVALWEVACAHRSEAILAALWDRVTTTSSPSSDSDADGTELRLCTDSSCSHRCSLVRHSVLDLKNLLRSETETNRTEDARERGRRWTEAVFDASLAAVQPRWAARGCTVPSGASSSTSSKESEIAADDKDDDARRMSAEEQDADAPLGAVHTGLMLGRLLLAIVDATLAGREGGPGDSLSCKAGISRGVLGLKDSVFDTKARGVIQAALAPMLLSLTAGTQDAQSALRACCAALNDTWRIRSDVQAALVRRCGAEGSFAAALFSPSSDLRQGSMTSWETACVALLVMCTDSIADPQAWEALGEVFWELAVSGKDAQAVAVLAVLSQRRLAADRGWSLPWQSSRRLDDLAHSAAFGSVFEDLAPADRSHADLLLHDVFEELLLRRSSHAAVLLLPLLHRDLAGGDGRTAHPRHLHLLLTAHSTRHLIWLREWERLSFPHAKLAGACLRASLGPDSRQVTTSIRELITALFEAETSAGVRTRRGHWPDDSDMKEYLEPSPFSQDDDEDRGGGVHGVASHMGPETATEPGDKLSTEYQDKYRKWKTTPQQQRDKSAKRFSKDSGYAAALTYPRQLALLDAEIAWSMSPEISLSDVEGLLLRPEALEKLLASGQRRGITVPEILNLSHNTLRCAGVRTLATWPRIGEVVRLVLAGNEIGDDGAECVAGIVERQVLVHLDLDFNKIGVRGAQSLAAAITKTSALTYLSLCANVVEDGGLKSLIDALQSKSQLSHLGIGALQVSESALNDAAKAIANLWSRFRTLQTIQVSSQATYMSSSCPAALCASALCVHGQVHNISVRTAEMYFVKHMLEERTRLRDLPSVLHINLDGNPLCNIGVKLLCCVIPHLSALQSLQLSGVGMGDKGFLAVVETLSTHPPTALVSLDLSGNDFLTGNPLTRNPQHDSLLLHRFALALAKIKSLQVVTMDSALDIQELISADTLKLQNMTEREACVVAGLLQANSKLQSLYLRGVLWFPLLRQPLACHLTQLKTLSLSAYKKRMAVTIEEAGTRVELEQRTEKSTEHLSNDNCEQVLQRMRAFFLGSDHDSLFEQPDDQSRYWAHGRIAAAQRQRNRERRANTDRLAFACMNLFLINRPHSHPDRLGDENSDSRVNLISTITSVDLKACNLSRFPMTLLSLREWLVHLDVSDNVLLESLPVDELASMPQLSTLECSGCPRLYMPPAEVAMQGGRHTMSFLKQLLVAKADDTRVTCVVIGDGQSGKSSVVSAIASQQNKAKSIPEDERTVGIEFSTWSAGQGISFTFCDLAGQAIYSMTHQFFIFRRAIYLFVWPAQDLQDQDVQQRDTDLADMVHSWMDSLQNRVPGAYVLPVCTHIDCVKNETELRRQIATVQTAINQKLSDQWSFGWASGIPTLHVLHPGTEEQGWSVPVCSADGRGILDLRTLLVESLQHLPFYNVPWPRAYESLRNKVEVRSGRQAWLTWREYAELGTECEFTPKQLEVATRYLHESGELRYFGNPAKAMELLTTDRAALEADTLLNTVFLDARWIIDVLKGVIRHDQQALETYLEETDAASEKHKLLLRGLRRLMYHGVLHRNLVPYLWPNPQAESRRYWEFQRGTKEGQMWPVDVAADKNDFNRVLALLKGFDIMVSRKVQVLKFENKGDRMFSQQVAEDEFVIPSLLAPSCKCVLEAGTLDITQCKYKATFHYPAMPSGFFQRLLTRGYAWASQSNYGDAHAAFYKHGRKVLLFKSRALVTGEHRTVLSVFASDLKSMRWMEGEIRQMELFFPGLAVLLRDVPPGDRYVDQSDVTIITAQNLVRSEAPQPHKFEVNGLVRLRDRDACLRCRTEGPLGALDLGRIVRAGSRAIEVSAGGRTFLYDREDALEEVLLRKIESNSAVAVGSLVVMRSVDDLENLEAAAGDAACLPAGVVGEVLAVADPGRTLRVRTLDRAREVESDAERVAHFVVDPGNKLSAISSDEELIGKVVRLNTGCDDAGNALKGNLSVGTLGRVSGVNSGGWWVETMSRRSPEWMYPHASLESVRFAESNSFADISKDDPASYRFAATLHAFDSDLEVDVKSERNVLHSHLETETSHGNVHRRRSERTRVSRVVLFCMDADTAQTHFCRKELEDWNSKSTPIIPLLFPQYTWSGSEWWPKNMGHLGRHTIFVDLRKHDEADETQLGLAQAQEKMWRTKLNLECYPQIIKYLEESFAAKNEKTGAETWCLQCLDEEVENPHKFDRNALLFELEDIQKGGTDPHETEVKCVHGHSQLLTEVLSRSVIREVIPCPRCIEHCTVPPHSFDRKECKLLLADEGGKKGGSMQCPNCMKAGRPWSVRILDVLPPDVFVSYQWGIQAEGSYLNQEVVRKLRVRIEAEADILCWLDVEGGMGAGEELTNMEDGICEAKVFLVFLSDLYVHSVNCRRELRAAFAEWKYIVPVLMFEQGSRGGVSSGWTGEQAGDQYWQHAEAMERNEVPDWVRKEGDVRWELLAGYKPIDLRPARFAALEPGSEAVMAIVREIVSRFHNPDRKKHTEYAPAQ